ncbi:AraC-type DNA-binding protein [Actinacidiphila yanglinensis]|uniref:AraC-type DNA-binding protein n=1 Tax=Actinacidiphila yanglinensis TaxID=310779 RepID=A0A1H6CUM0_9ACTN|nr:AraC-type DNA-binding protein [Actinacidiphila yanglinensis]
MCDARRTVGPVDIVGTAIAAMRAGEPRSARGRFTGAWGLRFDSAGGLGVHIVLQGSCWLLPPEGAPVQLTAGDVVLVPFNQAHGLANDPNTPLEDVRRGQQAYWQSEADLPPGVAPTVILGATYHLRSIRPHPLIANLPAFVHMPSRIGTTQTLRDVVNLLGAELESQQPGVTAAIPALLDLLLIYIVRCWYQRADVTDGWAQALRDPGISAALAAIEQHPEHPWTVGTLAREAGSSRAVFARRFHDLIGQPPVAYLTWWRMTAASHLLRETNQPLQVIAAKSGYQNEYAFSRAFKREFDTAPGSYRRTYCIPSEASAMDGSR